jgi:hypothetical protein
MNDEGANSTGKGAGKITPSSTGTGVIRTLLGKPPKMNDEGANSTGQGTGKGTPSSTGVMSARDRALAMLAPKRKGKAKGKGAGNAPYGGAAQASDHGAADVTDADMWLELFGSDDGADEPSGLFRDDSEEFSMAASEADIE